MATAKINYAHLFGIHSVAAPVVFAVAYVPFLGLYIFQSVRNPTYVYVFLAVFAILRIVAFGIRAALAGSESAGENLGLYIAEQILIGIGFFGLLFSAYTLVLDRESISEARIPNTPLMRITSNRRLFRLMLLIAVVLGIVGSQFGFSVNSSMSDRTLGKNLRVASSAIFLALTILQAYRTFMFTLIERSAGARSASDEKIGKRHGNWVLCLIAVLLLVREAYSIVSTTKPSVAANEKLFFPLLALTEILAVLLYATPGLVPSRKELQERQRPQLEDYNMTHRESPGV